MLPDHRGAWTAILIVSVFFGGFALLANLPALHSGFLFADQAVYYAMAQSIAYDRDLEYTAKDLIRYREDFWAGPLGIFLKRTRGAEGERLFYSKSPAYPLFAAPLSGSSAPTGPSSSTPCSSSSSWPWGSPISPWPTAPACPSSRS